MINHLFKIYLEPYILYYQQYIFLKYKNVKWSIENKK